MKLLLFQNDVQKREALHNFAQQYGGLEGLARQLVAKSYFLKVIREISFLI